MHPKLFQLNLSVLRNEEAPRHDRIVGLKQTAVKVLLELPDTARNCILQTVSFYGWESSLGAKWGLKFYMNTFLAECPSQWVLQKKQSEKDTSICILKAYFGSNNSFQLGLACQHWLRSRLPLQ